jgi:hypothetical protein
VETPLVAWAQVLLRRAQARAEAPDLADYKELPCNNTLAQFCLKEVRIYFERLSKEHKFNKVTPDLIAIKYVYMPMIRARLQWYIPIHNSKAIRKQKNRKHYLPVGKPRILYKALKPNIHDYQVPIHKETLA